ncbi:MAG: hypothetical protein IPN90_04665 [Elusimicrobia bacterium]|nr:hypothetical protein [Elusimicrobiota bacterium]
MNSPLMARTDVRRVRWALGTPFVTALGLKSHSDNVVVRVSLAGGGIGLGEASSSLAMPGQTGLGMAAAIRRLGRRFQGRDLRDIEQWVAEAWAAEGAWPTAVGAFESALWDALAQREGVPLCDLWGGACRELETVLSLSVLSPAHMGQRARRATRLGWRFLKLKLNGRDRQSQDRDRLRAVHRAAPRARILLDLNQSYTPEGLADFLHQAKGDGIPIELIEEPFAKRDWAALKEAKKIGGVPLLGDETIQNVDDARRACRGSLLRGVNVKLAKSGLLRSRAILDIFDRALKGRALLMVGCMAESRVGLAAAVHFALGLGMFDYVDLDSDLILSPTCVRGGYERDGAWIRLPKNPSPGLGLHQ